MDIDDYIDTDNISQALNNLTNQTSGTNLMSQGIINLGFHSYTELMGFWFFGFLFGIIGVAIYEYKQNIYHLIGYGIAVIVCCSVIIPSSIVDFISIIIGFAIAGILYKIFIKKGTPKDKEVPQ